MPLGLHCFPGVAPLRRSRKEEVLSLAVALPPVETLADLVDETTRAVVIVTPGNPTGVTIPPHRIDEIAAEARRLDVALIIDETYFTETILSWRDSILPVDTTILMLR